MVTGLKLNLKRFDFLFKFFYFNFNYLYIIWITSLRRWRVLVRALGSITAVPYLKEILAKSRMYFGSWDNVTIIIGACVSCTEKSASRTILAMAGLVEFTSVLSLILHFRNRIWNHYLQLLTNMFTPLTSTKLVVAGSFINGVNPHIVSSKKFLRTSSSPYKTLPNDKCDAPKEVCGERKLFYRPLKKWGQKQISDVRALNLCN